MASTVINSRNESSWGQSLGGFMGKKAAYTNPNPNSTNPSSNTNPKQPKLKKKHLQAVTGRQIDESPVVTQTAPEDAYSFNQRTVDVNRCRGDGFNQAAGGFVNIKVSTCTKAEINELKKRLESELERIRVLYDQIESRQFLPRSSQGKMKKISGQKRLLPVGPPIHRVESQLSNGVSLGNGDNLEALMKTCRQILGKLMKHKHSWVFNKPVDALALGLHDYHLIVKRPMDLGTVKSNFAKNLYSSPVDFAADVRLTFNNAMLYNPKTDEVHRMAAQLLSEFETKFGPVQEKLQAGARKETNEFVNEELQGSSWNEMPTAHSPPRPKKPKTNLIGSIPKKPERIPEPVQKHKQSSASNPSKFWDSERNPEPVQEQNQSSASIPSNSNPRSAQSPVPVPSPSPVKAQPVKPAKPSKGASSAKGASSVKEAKLPKPRAKDPNKREMNMEEKHRLGVGLQSLPQEKMPQLVQIIRKRNDQVAQDGDVIELDIEALDTETLWELDRFVTNWKKLVSKTKRQALMDNYSAAPTVTTDTDEAPISYKNDGAKKIKKGDGDEDVDIGDEMPESSFPHVEIEKDDGGHGQDHAIKNDQGTGHANGNASSSSSSSGSSGSDSSSSSDSDSGSSSGSDSDADEAQS